jgi:hypothetical protein
MMMMMDTGMRHHAEMIVSLMTGIGSHIGVKPARIMTDHRDRRVGPLGQGAERHRQLSLPNDLVPHTKQADTAGFLALSLTGVDHVT